MQYLTYQIKMLHLFSVHAGPQTTNMVEIESFEI